MLQVAVKRAAFNSVSKVEFKNGFLSSFEVSKPGFQQNHFYVRFIIVFLAESFLFCNRILLLAKSYLEILERKTCLFS
ncbi:hypothetical protein LIMHP_11830 [Leptospira interrogans serovar Manilae]|nr:hypothetical protein LIMLP_11830 [Leptospira interrogans serovar Manilae]AKP30336.1 hypothetical protein LIMHP_11830 [Leptospira interrogans serovar Manilae]EYU64906.1 hypothetical protein CI00_01600 [Leptospira interrogans serovar Manilae]